MNIPPLGDEPIPKNASRNITKSMAVGAVVGAVIMFVWGAFSHLVLLIGVGFTPLPREDAVLDMLRSSIPADGLYFFPGKNLREKTPPQQEAAWEAKYHAGPTGFLVYHPAGGDPLSPVKLLTQFLGNLLAASIAAFIISLVFASYGQRVLVITLLGVFAWLTISLIYWNWYGYPGSFFVAQGVDQ